MPETSRGAIMTAETASDRQNESIISKLESINRNLRFLHQISRKISEKKPLSHLLTDIMENSKVLMNAEASSLLLYDPGDDKLHFMVATGEKGNVIKKFSVEMGQGIAGWTAAHRKPLLVDDCYKDSRFNASFDSESNFTTRSMICVPLVRNEKLLGVMQVINKKGGGVFDEEDLSLFEILASQCAVAIENHDLIQRQIEAETLAHELEIAREIQMHLLPKSLPSYEDLEMASQLIPAKKVGGDYYNVFRIDEQKTLLFLADVSGKSISAALIVSIIDSCLHSYLKMADRRFNLMELVSILNRVLIESTTSSKFATGWFGLYNHLTAELTSVNAGHNPPYLFREKNTTVQSLEKGGIFLGALDTEYESENLTLASNDILVYYTDGITEAWNENNEDYGEDRLINTVLQAQQHSAFEILRLIEEDVQSHVGKAVQSDDMACIVLKKR